MKRTLRATDIDRLENTSFVTALCGQVTEQAAPAGGPVRDAEAALRPNGWSICCNHTLCSGNTFASSRLWGDVAQPYIANGSDGSALGKMLLAALDPVGTAVDQVVGGGAGGAAPRNPAADDMTGCTQAAQKPFVLGSTGR